MVQYPCKDCPNKGCGSYHNQCKPYLAAKAQAEEIRKQQNKERESNAYAHQNHIRIDNYCRKHR